MTSQRTPSTHKRLAYLGAMIGKYAHRWDANPSSRLMGWVDEYNAIKRDNPLTFAQYCVDNGYAQDHTAYDVLAS